MWLVSNHGFFDIEIGSKDKDALKAGPVCISFK